MRRWQAALIGVVVAFCAASQAVAQTSAPTNLASDATSTAGVAGDVGVIESLRLGALDLKARHVRPPGGSLATLLLVHDTLGSYDDPLIVKLQAAMAERGIATLAINLSLGVDGRIAALGCNEPQAHRHEDALDEIDAWTDWLLGQGLGPVVLVGHGRGGAQAAWHLAARAGGRIAAAMLLAPTGWTPRQADAEYRGRYAAGIAALVTRIAGREPDDIVENVPFLHCGAAEASKAAIESYYGAQPMRDAPTALVEVTTGLGHGFLRQSGALFLS